MEWTNNKTDPLALSEEVTRPSLKKAEDVIVHFAQKVKLHFDDIFVSTVKAVYFTLYSRMRICWTTLVY